MKYFIYDIILKIAKKKLNNKKYNKNNDLLKQLSKYLFWDVNLDILDIKYHCNLIIERIIYYGNENDINMLNKLYSINKIKKNIIKLYIYNDKKIEYYSSIFNIKKEKFKCYGKIPRHVNY